jgi:hypothetical protein
MLNARSFLVVAALTGIAAGCQASPLGNDAPNAGPLFGGQTLGSGHTSDSMATPEIETDGRSGNLFGSGT